MPSKKRGLHEHVPMGQAMQLVKSRIEQIEELGQPIESPRPPPPLTAKRLLWWHSAALPQKAGQASRSSVVA